MRLSLFNQVIGQTTTTFKRFSFSLLCAFAATGLAIFLVEKGGSEPSYLFNIILVAILGIPLFAVIKLTDEQRGWPSIISNGILAGGLLLLVVYFLTLPSDIGTSPYKYIYRYVLYFLGVHLLVAVGPYIGNSHLSAFWQYNKTLFLRFLTALFFSGVLFVGLTVALGSIQLLFEVDVEEVRYLQLFILLGGVFNTWFFLAGIPPARTAPTAYPKGLKVFTQNVLIPLVILYLFILYLYTGKILLQWSWPEGWITYLVLSFSITGILALLLLYPVRERVENRWINTFANSFFWALVPLVILLLLAILRRIWEYSFTIERYFVLMLGLWLAGIVIYFLVTKKQNIKVIPASLCIMAFLISFGPWSAFSVAEQSQLDRLRFYLNKNGILQNGQIQKTATVMKFEDRRQISSILRYLNSSHGLKGLQPWFAQDLDSLTWKPSENHTERSVPYYQRPEKVAALLGITYVGEGVAAPETKLRNEFHVAEQSAWQITDVQYLIPDLYWSENQQRQSFTLGDTRTLIVESNKEAPHIRLHFSDEQAHTASINLKQMIDTLSAKFPAFQTALPPSAMSIPYVAGNLTVTMYIEHIVWDNHETKTPIRVNYSIGVSAQKATPP